MCYKGKAPYREIDVNHQADEYKAEAKRFRLKSNAKV